ncbi:SET and MYND domain-containing protein 4-like [Penaeus chinensis]|uniref:SET and MYND domain-containing protein 4-like n=1 Tax=Penaeus chinensis TaxID=139456 RepID=UPI001FB5BE03|nr:SET and MYND domain-containing protein 4-like [Penaeus chinensis]
MSKTLSQLTDEFLNGFEGCAIMKVVDSFRREKSLSEMMSFLLSLPEAHRHLTPAECPPEFKRDFRAAECFRAKGKSYYEGMLIEQALQMFSTSILLAPHPPRRPYPAAGKKESSEGSETPFLPFSREEEEDEENQALSLGYANRSAMLLELKQYSLCLRDIGLALRLGYPKRLRYKLISRWAKCLIALKRDREAEQLLNAALEGLGSLPCDDLTLASAKVSLLMVRQTCKNSGSSRKGSPSLSLDALALVKEEEFKVPSLNNNINWSAPALSSAVKVAYSRTKGRHLLATRDIKPGELLCSEKSFATVLNPEIRGNCAHCLVDYGSVIIPCPDCTEVLFCSLKCQQEALSTYHRVECPIGPTLASLALPPHALLAFRVAAKVSFKKLKREEAELRKEGETQKAATLGFNDKKKYVSSSYRAVYHLNTNQALRPDLDLFHACVTAFVLLKLLQKSGRYFCCEKGQPCSPSHEDLVLVGTALCAHVLRATCNGLPIIESVRHVLLKGSHGSVNIGLGLFPTLSLANHSCDPTATVLTCQTGSLMMSLSFIPKGGEVTRSYGVSYLRMEKKRRRALLQEGYQFLCSCHACENDWPLYEDLPNSLILICLKCSEPLCSLSLKCWKCKIDYGIPLTKREAKLSNRYFCMEIVQKIESARQEFVCYANPPVKFDETEKNILCDMLLLLDKYTKLPMKLVVAGRHALNVWLKFWGPAKHFQ